MFQTELQYDDIKGPTEIDPTRIPEFPASSALQSIEGQNLKGAAFDVLQAYAEQARMADMRQEAFYTLARETGIPAAQLQPMVALTPALLGPTERPAAQAPAGGLPRLLVGRGRRRRFRPWRGGGRGPVRHTPQQLERLRRPLRRLAHPRRG